MGVGLLLDVVAYDSGLVALPVALLLGVALVVLFFTLGNRNFCFYQMPLPVQRCANAGLALLSNRLVYLCQLFGV